MSEASIAKIFTDNPNLIASLMAIIISGISKAMSYKKDIEKLKSEANVKRDELFHNLEKKLFEVSKYGLDHYYDKSLNERNELIDYIRESFRINRVLNNFDNISKLANFYEALLLWSFIIGVIATILSCFPILTQVKIAVLSVMIIIIIIELFSILSLKTLKNQVSNNLDIV